jgi:FtsJ-like methyltransferase
VLKSFNLFIKALRDILHILASCFSTIVIFKPLTSRPSNSERYIICKDFTSYSPSLVKDLCQVVKINKKISSLLPATSSYLHNKNDGSMNYQSFHTLFYVLC